MTKRKRITWFIDPALIRKVKLTAPLGSDGRVSQSDVVEEALRRYFDPMQREDAEPALAEAS